jgi:hypothetical protein
MTTSTSTSNHSPLYIGREFPIDQLTPTEFEDFVFACLLCISEDLGFRTHGMPSGTGDGGFDVQGEVISSKQTVCVQCKHQQQPLDSPQIAEELAKVAARSALEGTTVSQHRFICTGGVRKKLIQQLRETPRQHIASLAGEKLATAQKGELLTLKKRLNKSKRDPREVAESYVKNLDVILAWDFHEFDVSLSSHWNDILPIAQRFFRIETVVLEYPRPRFDRSAYVDEHRDFRLTIEPRVAYALLPSGVSTAPSTDPASQDASSTKSITNLFDLVSVEGGDLIVLLGNGGAGKTEALRRVRALILQSRSDSTLPILFSLSKYTPGGLDRVIHQELDVIHGTWHSLPDQIILLCDELNEVSATNARAFLSELEPLLRRKKVACILSMRDAVNRAKIVLPPATYGCARVESITPIGIRHLAEAALSDEGANKFVPKYRAIADASGSPLLWTPFAVRAALKLWLRDEQLPSSLGGMLEVLLKSRCERNTEQEREHLDPDVILQLAGALAFQRLVVDGEVGCSGTEAGKWIRAAKLLCENALGVSDSTDIQITELLIAHDLLRHSAEGYYSFEHHLTAGALAAPLLAQQWRHHLESLNDQVSDDGWVFAARLIPADEVNEYLDALFNVDLILGARAARDLQPHAHQHAMEILNQCVAISAQEAIRISGGFALAALGSPEAIAKLQELAEDTTSDVHSAARTALATTGDQAFLTRLLTAVDAMAAAPFQMSGGDIAVWQSAPLAKRLDVARQRLADITPGDHVGESLFLISFERDKDDVALIESHLQAATSLKAWGQALAALNTVMPDRASAGVEASISGAQKAAHRASLLRIASLAGVNIDIRAACQCVFEDDSALQSNPGDGMAIINLINDVLAKSTIPPDVIELVERKLPGSSGDRRQNLWSLAMSCRSYTIANFAVSLIETWDKDVWSACNYFIHHPDLADERRAILTAACEAGLKGESEWWIPRTERALSLLAQLEFSEDARNLLSSIMERLNDLRDAIESGTLELSAPDDRGPLKGVLPTLAPITLEMIAAGFLDVIAKVHKVLPANSLSSLLKFDFHSSSSTDELREALSDHCDEEIDAVLDEIESPMTLVRGLVVICPRGATETRIRLLDRVLRLRNAPTTIMHQLCEAVAACCSRAVLEMIVKAVSEIPTWSNIETQLFWNFVRVVGRKVSKEDESVIEEALAHAQTAFAKRILEAWRLQASQERIGVAKLQP